MRRGRLAWLLVGGQALGQLGMLIALPVVTRAYPPHDVGLYQIANALALIAQPIATWRLEFIIPTADTERTARRLFRRGLGFISVVASLSLLVAGLGNLFVSEDIAAIAAMVVPLIIAYALLVLDNAVLIRRRLAGPLAARNFLSGVLGGALQVWAALGGQSILVLALAVLAARLFAIVLTRRSWLVTDDGAIREPTYTLKRAIPTVLAGVVSNSSVNALPLLIPISGSTASAGFAGTAQRIAGAPASFVGQALGQLVQSKVAPIIRERQPGVRGAVSLYLRNASVPSGVVAVALALGGPLLAEPILGPGWQPAGTMLALLAIPYSLQLLVAPINPVLVMIARERELLLMQLARLILAVAAAVLAGVATGEALAVVAAFSAVTTAAYIATVVVILLLCGRADREYGADPS